MSRRTCSISVIPRPHLTLVVERRAVARDAADVVDVGDGPDLAYNLLDVRYASRLESEPAQGRPVLDGIHPRRQYVHPRIRDGRGYVLEEVHPVQRLDQQLHREEPPFALRPLDLGEALRVARVQRSSIRASRRVYYDAAAQRDIAHDVIPGQRAAAASEPREDTAGPDDLHPRLRIRTSGIRQRQGYERRATRPVLSPRLLLFFFGLYLLHDPVCHVLRREGAEAHGGEHVLRRWIVGALRHILPDVGRDLVLVYPLLFEER